MVPSYLFLGRVPLIDRNKLGTLILTSLLEDLARVSRIPSNSHIAGFKISSTQLLARDAAGHMVEALAHGLRRVWFWFVGEGRLETQG